MMTGGSDDVDLGGSTSLRHGSFLGLTISGDGSVLILLPGGEAPVDETGDRLLFPPEGCNTKGPARGWRTGVAEEEEEDDDLALVRIDSTAAENGDSGSSVFTFLGVTGVRS